MLHHATLPPREEMYRALRERDSEYDGVFFAAIRTTGIFCRSTCTARKPRPENVEFFPTTADALTAGYRPCRRCEPMVPSGETPGWLTPLLSAVDDDPARRWTDADVRALGIEHVILAASHTHSGPDADRADFPDPGPAWRSVMEDRVVEMVREKGKTTGFNALTRTYEDMFKAGIVDPAKVVRSALQNAGSIAGLLLTTNTLVVDLKKESKDPVEGAVA